jgi:iron complex outermembrane receptor protein
MSYHPIHHKKTVYLAVLGTLISSPELIAAENIIVTAPVVVTATRVEQNSFDLPVAIDVVEKKDIQNGQLQMTLSESLIRVPGITAQNRTNQSQDPQISSRGFGSRSSFGVRGVRVYVDGIPLSMPDGQGQPGVVDLAAIKSIEVMRGPFSALYGNSSGGVVQMFTEDAPKTLEVGGTVMFGSYDTKRQIMNATGTSENIEYLLSVSNFETSGYRKNSAGDKQQATAKFKINISDDTKVNALVNWFEQDAEDPLGLPRVATANDPSAFSNPKDVPNSAYRAKTRVSRDHTQVGFNIEHAINTDNKITLMTYVGNRNNLQYLSTSATTAVGRASSIDRGFWGADLRWNNTGNLFSLPYDFAVGVTYGKMDDKRLDINTDNGVKRQLMTGNGNFALNRDEDNISTNFDQYVQGKISLSDKVDIHAGARHSKVKLEVKDKFLTGSANNGNNSGSVEYQKTTPVIGAVWKVDPALNLYANFGKGFETPTFIEAAFTTSAANSTPNLSLKPSESNNYEIGAKAFLGSSTQVNLTLYNTTTNNEIVTQDNISGRASFTNANKTKRSGAELSISSELENNVSLYGAYTLLNAKFDSAYTNRLGNTIESGNRIPGTYKTQLYGEIAWKYSPLGFSTALEGRHNSKVYVDDTNSDAAHSYTIFNLRAGFTQNLEKWNFSEYIRVENIFDKDYIGSVRINDGNSRFFEPAAGTNYLLGLSAQYKF